MNVNSPLCSNASKSEEWFLVFHQFIPQGCIRLSMFSWKSKKYLKALYIFSLICIGIMLQTTHRPSINLSLTSACIIFPDVAPYSIPFFVSLDTTSCVV